MLRCWLRGALRRRLGRWLGRWLGMLVGRQLHRGLRQVLWCSEEAGVWQRLGLRQRGLWRRQGAVLRRWRKQQQRRLVWQCRVQEALLRKQLQQLGRRLGRQVRQWSRLRSWLGRLRVLW